MAAHEVYKALSKKLQSFKTLSFQRKNEKGKPIDAIAATQEGLYVRWEGRVARRLIDKPGPRRAPDLIPGFESFLNPTIMPKLSGIASITQNQGMECYAVPVTYSTTKGTLYIDTREWIPRRFKSSTGEMIKYDRVSSEGFDVSPFHR